MSGVRKEDFHSKTLLPFHGNSCPTNNNYHYQRPPISGRQGGGEGTENTAKWKNYSVCDLEGKTLREEV